MTAGQFEQARLRDVLLTSHALARQVIEMWERSAGVGARPERMLTSYSHEAFAVATVAYLQFHDREDLIGARGLVEHLQSFSAAEMSMWCDAIESRLTDLI